VELYIAGKDTASSPITNGVSNLTAKDSESRQDGKKEIRDEDERVSRMIFQKRIAVPLEPKGPGRHSGRALSKKAIPGYVGYRGSM
jgi:hypothetical protein